MDRVLAGTLLGCCLFGTPVFAAEDGELARGKELLRQGEYDQAAVVLDRVTRRLGTNAKAAREAASAHVHLALAYVGLAQDTLARANFKEALRRDPSIQLTASDQSPKVLELFQTAKDELAREKLLNASSKKGGSKAPLVIGLAALGAGGAAIGLKGGGGGGGDTPSGSSGTPITTGCPSPITVASASISRGATVSMSSPQTLTLTLNLAATGNGLTTSGTVALRAPLPDGSQRDCYMASVATVQLQPNCAASPVTTTFLLDASARSRGCDPPFRLGSAFVNLTNVNYSGGSVQQLEITVQP